MLCYIFWVSFKTFMRINLRINVLLDWAMSLLSTSFFPLSKNDFYLKHIEMLCSTFRVYFDIMLLNVWCFNQYFLYILQSRHLPKPVCHRIPLWDHQHINNFVLYWNSILHQIVGNIFFWTFVRFSRTIIGLQGRTA